MDSKRLQEIVSMISDFLDNDVQEGIPVVKFKDNKIDFDGIKIDSTLLLQEVDDEFTLERLIEVEATKFDSADTFYEELATTSTIEEMLPFLKEAIEENQEEEAASAWLDYENDIETEVEDDDDDF